MLFRTFKEEYDKHHAFDNFISVAEAKDLGVIPEYYHKFFPDKCECGSENIITFNLQQPQCCNPRCIVKQSYALSEFFNRFNCKGLGPNRCYEILQSLSPRFMYNSYIEVLNVQEKDLPINLAQKAFSSDLLYAIYKIKTSQFTFPELVSKLAIPTLGDKSLKLLEGINSFQEFQDKIKKDGNLTTFCSKRGIYDRMVLFWIRNSAIDICIADFLLRGCIRKSGIIKIEICITGFLYLDGKRITKDEFIKRCNEEARDDNGVQLFEIIQNTAKVSAVHIIADSPSRSSKYLAGLKRGAEIDIDGVRRNVLMSSNDFINYLKELKNKWTEKRKSLQLEMDPTVTGNQETSQTLSTTVGQEMGTAEVQTTTKMKCF